MEAKQKMCIICAMAQNRVIGNGGNIPWRSKEDMRHFKALTEGGIVVMGRKTFDSLPENFKPLPNRINIVVSRSREFQETKGEANCVFVGDLWTAIKQAKDLAVAKGLDRIWIIGGGEIYKQCLPMADEIFLTVLDKSYDGDTYFPNFEENFALVEKKRFSDGNFCRYQRVREI